MSIKKPLLSIVQEILSAMGSEQINTISDSTEGEDVAAIVQTTFYNIIAARDIPEHEEMLKLTTASDGDFPTHMKFGDNVKEVKAIWYMDGNYTDYDYKRVHWLPPMDFIEMIDKRQDNYVIVDDKTGGGFLKIQNNKRPQYYTSFDDEWIVFDSFDSAADDTLHSKKFRALGTVYPVFRLKDSYVPEIDATMFPYLIAEAKSAAMSLFKGGVDAKTEQWARRNKSHIQNDMFKTERKRRLPHYGR